MSRKIRFAAAALAALTVLAIIAGCGNTPDPATDGTSSPAASDVASATVEQTTPVTEYIDTLEKRDLQKRVFTVIGQSTEDRQNFYIEGNAGEVINESIRKRDWEVEERLNIQLNYIAEKDRKKVTSSVHKTVNSGEKAYDLVLNSLSDGFNTMTSNGDLRDLKTIPHLSLESKYWNKSMTENMELYGKLYFTTGPISPQLYQTPIVMMANLKIAEEYKLENPYKVVLEGRWTIEKLAQMMKDVSYDYNNDGVMGEDDFWGLVVDPTFGNALYVGAGLDGRQKEDGGYRIAVGDEAFLNLIDKCSALFGDRNAVLNNPQGAKDYDLLIFKPGRALFIDDTVNGVLLMRDMEDDFAVIPCPKATEEQENYYSTCNTWLPSGIGVPYADVGDAELEETGLILETMAVYSYDHIVPAVYEITLRGKVSRDADNYKTLDIIFENLSFDFVSVFNPGGVSDILRNAMIGDYPNYVSAYGSIKKTAQKALDDFASIAQKQQ